MRRSLILLFVACWCALGCSEKTAKTKIVEEVAPVRAGPISPLPLSQDVDRRKAALGNKLFHDPILSGDGTISCASCHDIANGGDDGLKRSVGIGGAIGGINAPTVLNATFNFVQFWDGRAKTLSDQARGPVAHPKEMGAKWEDVVTRLDCHDTYAAEFRAIYKDGVTEDNVVDAIAEFEKTLVTANGPFDRWLRGEDDAIGQDAKDGYELFQSLGCVACHQGRNVGGNMYQYFGVMGDYFAKRGDLTEADLGRFNVTKNPADKHLFRVPSLRNIEHTAPYFHDGSAATLDDAINTMVKFQLGRPITDAQRRKVKAFLVSLSGPLPSTLGDQHVQ